MTLDEACEPLFQYICRLNRSARKGGSVDYAVLRSEIKGLLADVRNRAAENQLADQYNKVEMPLTFFVDSMIAESPLGAAAEWNQNRLAYEYNELAGDEKFYDLLDETLADPTEAAAERLVVFYTCIGLGFTGWYAGQPDYLKQKMKEISARIRSRALTDRNARICDEAYRHMDTRNLIAPPGKKLIGIVIALVGLIVTLFATNMVLYRQASRELAKSLKTVIDHEKVLTGEDMDDE
jgi:type IV/VI secretion system ImpK/VasF family protein